MNEWNKIKSEMAPERRVRLNNEIDRELLAIELSELCEQSGKTQAETAEITKTILELSKFEQCDDRPISVLRRYVKVLGGNLEIVAVFNNKRIVLMTG